MTLELETNSPRPEAMWSISRIAERDKVSKPTVSIHVKRLIQRHGLTVTRDGLGRVAAVNVVQYDELRARFADPSKAQAPRLDDVEPGFNPPTTPAKDLNSYDEAVRQRAWLDMEKRRLELAQIKVRLVRADVVEASVGKCCNEMVRLIDRLPQEADAVALMINSDDVHAIRLALKALAHRLRTSLAKAFEDLQVGAPATDDDLSDDAEEGE